MGKQKENQYQHFVPRFLLRNFSDDKEHVYKYENGKSECCNISETGGDYCFYGIKDCSLENFNQHLESVAARTISQHEKITDKKEIYMKLFIQSNGLSFPISKSEIERIIQCFNQIKQIA